MPIESVANLGATQNMGQLSKANLATQQVEKSFGSYLKDALENVNELQHVSDDMTHKLIIGKEVDLHNVMIAAQKASIALNATVEIRNKMVEAYQEVARMPV